MSNDETADELGRLREEVAALQDARREKAAAETAEPAVVEVARKETAATAPNVDELSATDKSQLDELAELLQAEIKDLPTVTCLAVFSLGILMGRLMR